jgi:hypothetical protein
VMSPVHHRRAEGEARHRGSHTNRNLQNPLFAMNESFTNKIFGVIPRRQTTNVWLI